MHKNKSFIAIVSFFTIALFSYLSFSLLMPSSNVGEDVTATEFSSDRALAHLKEISQHPHYVGSEAHSEVRDYLLTQLELLGLEDVHIQEDFTVNEKWNVLAKPKNIVAKIPGSENGKALLLMAHYDSAPHTASFGASDAGSGVVAILESVRAYLAAGNTPKNDIIILFSDAEEIGLVGARLFVKQHPWAKDVGLTINFEARGSGGPSNMIVETNDGNSQLIKEFSRANPKYPVASSLMYSIYKMLPNDTDSTVFREDGDIDGFFFAFIDDHYDYHTANDTFENLDRNTLQHQGSYAMAMLSHFANVDLSTVKSNQDDVYFNFPVVNMLHYPFSWVVTILILAFILFSGILIIGLAKKNLNIKSICMGFVPFLISLIVSVLLSMGLLWLIGIIYPQYNEVLHKFPYNTHLYIAALVLLALAVSFGVYRLFTKKEGKANLLVAPLFFWLLIHTAIAIYLKGAAYFIIPTFFGLVSFFLLVKDNKPNLIILTVLAAPAVFILVPLIQFFPVGLGISMSVFSVVFTVLVFGLLLPVFLHYNGKRILSILSLLACVVFLIVAHTKSAFDEGREKPNSLVYFVNTDNSTAYWATYDNVLDEWTKAFLGENPNEANEDLKNTAASKYGNAYTYATEADVKPIAQPDITIAKDTLINDERHLTLHYIPRRNVNRISVYGHSQNGITTLQCNGKKMSYGSNASGAIQSSALVDYYVSDNDSLTLAFTTAKDSDVQLTFQEMSLDLLENSLFTVPKRPAAMIPKPFITNDAVILQKTITIPPYKVPQATTENEND